jgi:glycosyltransferase involved in cell wall biosynthesis
MSRIKPDILDAHNITVYGYLGVASGFHPLVLTVWGSDILIDPKQNAVYRFLSKQALKRADCIMCCSSAIKGETMQLGAAPEKAEVVFIGTNTTKFSPTQKDTMILQRLNIPESSPVVISIRSLRPVYDVETLIRAIPLVLEEVPEVRFIIGGQGEQRNYLEKLAQHLGISDSIRFVGWILPEELPGYLASSDVYVSTSLSDGTSISLLEAMACELAPVVTHIPANQPWIKDGENGFLFPVKNHKMLATKIAYLIKNAETRKEFGKESRRIVQEKAEYEKEMAKVERIYQGLVERTGCE